MARSCEPMDRKAGGEFAMGRVGHIFARRRRVGHIYRLVREGGGSGQDKDRGDQTR